MHSLYIMCTGVLLGLAGMTQALAQAPPSDSDLLQYRAQAAESQVKYLSGLLWRAEVQQKATAEWWAAYVAGLTPAIAEDKR